MDVLKLLDEIEDIVESSSSLLFSKKIMIDSEEILEIIKEIRIRLPDEIKQAIWIKEEKQRILAEAQRDADNLVNEAEYRLEELVDKEEVSRIAKLRAEELIKITQNNAKEIRLGAIEYADSILIETHDSIKKLIKEINENRKELRGN